MLSTLKNIAGNPVDIFLYHFELHGNGISFILNEGIGEDMYKDIDEKMHPLVHACCETLLRYKHLSVSNIIMDGNILSDGCFEVMLSKGLGRQFASEEEKQRLFQDAKKIADLLMEVMDRRGKEEKAGKRRSDPVVQYPKNPEQARKELEKLGRKKHLEAKAQHLAEGKPVRPGLRQLRPEDLPAGVTASSGYDHRGLCYVFSHKSLGELGRIVMIKKDEDHMLMQADICNEQEPLDSPRIKKKKEVFKKVIAAVHACFPENIG